MPEMFFNPLIQGMTMNPTLMKKAGITNYRHWRFRHKFFVIRFK
jgi:hypothetical protein